MRQVTVGLVQLNPVLGNVEQNVESMCQIVENTCLQQHVDLFIFPELATTGYECGVRFADLAEREEDDTIRELARQAATSGTHLVFGMAQKQKVESVIYSAVVMIDNEGKVAANYQKVHLKGEQRLIFRPGYKYATAQASFGSVGLLAGWDLAFPEVARSLALEGAEILCVCGSWEAPYAHEWRSYSFSRAYENAVFVAACNRGGQEPTYSFFGESMVVGPRGVVHGRLEDDEPAVCLATIDLDQVRQAQEETQLLQGRQPRSYRGVVKMY